MSNEITVRASIAVAGGPTRSIHEALTLQAYDVVQVPVDAGATRNVEVQPDDGAQLRLLLITASAYARELTYRVGPADDAPELRLDQPLLLLGESATALLGAAPTSMSFTNGTDEDVLVHIVVGRDAVQDQ
ncbi:hypothetical protein SAMN05660350_00459 [Geodermatophilus obscurus]|uniref:Uncharacterized protein n=1 Tax=Geodermatophilus obscurus TaxID=1861 RepID=A0A1M7S473_9ACTN|nr:hypothetical protein [Geodermatophilus obscurus]SHN53092.1 hypothetical protein SAMN05660350_00459 [Geodermatophilus obscurus]